MHQHTKKRETQLIRGGGATNTEFKTANLGMLDRSLGRGGGRGENFEKVPG